MTRYTKYIGVVKISDPAKVQNKCTALGIDYHKGMVFCTIPEIGFASSDLVPCRYGLAIPYMRVQVGWKLLLEPTIIENSGLMKRWFFIGFSDCGGDNSSVTPATGTQLLIQLLSQVIYADSDNKMYLSAQDANEPFVLGDTLKTELDKHLALLQGLYDAITDWSPVALDGGSALKVALGNFITLGETSMPDYSDILSKSIFGE